MHPIERLRFIAQADDESARALAEEAAFTLAELAVEDAAAVVMAGRRLVERHPSCGPLWWVCSGLIETDDPYGAAERLSAELYSDPTPARLADSLRQRAAASDAIAALLPAEVLVEALERRGAGELRVIGCHRSLGSAMRALGRHVDEIVGYEFDESESALSGAALLVVEVCLAGKAGVVVGSECAAAIELAGRLGVPAVAVAGTGRVLSSPLPETAVQLARGELVLVDPGDFACLVGEDGSEDPAAALSRPAPGCPALARGVRKGGSERMRAPGRPR